MNDTDPTTPSAEPRRYPSAPDGWGAAPAAAPSGWDAAPTAGQTATDTRTPGTDPYAAEWDTARQTPTPWYGNAQAQGRTKPRPPWFWPVIAAAVGVAALLVGGGVGFAIGHAIGGTQSQGTSQFPGRGTNGFPGYGGGTGQQPGSTQGGTDSGSGS
ncbi:hypothetical protein [Curtobacterium sp. NPDC089689]|uniref:hypothetical protein n=1 Tax=Curtobacterium sp. NPDC089689 TaxID=3363968 RepID=UPI0038273B8D